MTQGASRTPPGARVQSISAFARPSEEHVRALKASGALEVRLFKKFTQRPLLSVWEGEDKAKAKVFVTVLDACATPSERERVMGAAKSLVPLAGVRGIQHVHRVMDDVDAFPCDRLAAGTAADLVVLRLPLTRKLEFMVDVATALAALHEAGIVHGCLCPDNIFLDDDLHPVLSEIGMVSIAESLDGDPESVFGYGAYANAETKAGGPTMAGDVYSVGRLLTFVMLDHVPESDAQLAEVDAMNKEVGAIVRKCALPVGHGYASMAELAAELQRCRQRAAPTQGVQAKRPAEPKPEPEAAVAKPADAPRARGTAEAAPRSNARWLGALVSVTALGVVIFMSRGSRLDDADVGTRGIAAQAFVRGGGRDLHGKHFQRADFSGLSLVDANLDKADLTAATFSHAKMNNAKVRGTSFVLADFDGADLRGVALEDAFGVDTATCDDATVLPEQWHCSPDGKVRMGPPSH